MQISPPPAQAISIRAPARGATDTGEGAAVDSPISIRAPARGATGLISVISACIINFNPRSREGSDEEYRSGDETRSISIRAPARGATFNDFPEVPGIYISIRAPARGATSIYSSRLFILSNFNPRSREGSDTACSLLLIFSRLFQSALPRGERHQFSPKNSLRS